VNVIQATKNLTFHIFHISIFKQQLCLENKLGITTTLITLCSNSLLHISFTKIYCKSTVSCLILVMAFNERKTLSLYTNNIFIRGIVRVLL